MFSDVCHLHLQRKSLHISHQLLACCQSLADPSAIDDGLKFYTLSLQGHFLALRRYFIAIPAHFDALESYFDESRSKQHRSDGVKGESGGEKCRSGRECRQSNVGKGSLGCCAELSRIDCERSDVPVNTKVGRVAPRAPLSNSGTARAERRATRPTTLSKFRGTGVRAGFRLFLESNFHA